jgi:hypothetical protein
VKTTAAAIIIVVLALGCANVQTTKDTISGNGLWGEIKRLVPADKIVGPIDEAYESFTYIEWFTWIPRSSVPTLTNAWDCDDYSLEAMVETRKKYRLSNKSCTTPAIGVVIGKLEQNFLGMKEGGLHAMNIIHVKDLGWMFYEPQTHQTVLVRAALQEKMFTVHWILF